MAPMRCQGWQLARLGERSSRRRGCVHIPTKTVRNGCARLPGFVIAGADRRWVHATAHLDGADVVVQAAGVPEPVAVRYAYSAGPVGQNLWNRDCLPAAPFRSDDFEMLTKPKP